MHVKMLYILYRNTINNGLTRCITLKEQSVDKNTMQIGKQAKLVFVIISSSLLEKIVYLSMSFSLFRFCEKC